MKTIFALLLSCPFTAAWAGVDFCPPTEARGLPILAFAPSADSRSTRGICTLKAEALQGYETQDLGRKEVAVTVGCDRKDMLLGHLTVEVSYKESLSRCQSAIGCLIECYPQVTPVGLPLSQY